MKKIKFYGAGGQGIVTAAKILCYSVCIHEGQSAKTIPAYGHERRGAPVFADVIIDNKPVLLNSFVYVPDMVAVFDPFIEQKGINLKEQSWSDALIVINDSNPPQDYLEYYQNVYYVNATQIALTRSGNPIPNLAMLGALARTGLVTLNSLEKSVVDFFGNREKDINLAILKEAYDATRKM